MDEDLLAAMYADDEPSKSKPIEANDLRSRKIRVGIVEYEVPTVQYVRHLELLVTQQAKMIEQMQREMARLSATLRGTRGFIRRQTDNITNMRYDLARRT